MGGLFAAASDKNCNYDLFFGTDYHSHLGTKRGGMAVYGKNGFHRAIHSIENSPFRTKFEKDVDEMDGKIGIGCISDNESQPLIVRSHLGNFAITTVGLINNADELIKMAFDKGTTQFLETSGGEINPTELAASIINRKDSIVEGIKYAQELIKGSMTMLILATDGIYAARDRLGRTPLIIGKKDGAFCASFESFAYLNLGYKDYKELGPGEIVFFNNEKCETVSPPGNEMKICSFLWVYYGYPSSSYEGVNVETMRYKCGEKLAENDSIKADMAAGIPDSGTAHAIGYANRSGIPFLRPFIKYTPTWPRSFTPQKQSQRDFIARMKLIPVNELIINKKIIMVEDSIVRGTQMRELNEFLCSSGAEEVHVRLACPPILYGCKYLNFSRSKSEMDLITRRIIAGREGNRQNDPEILNDYANCKSRNYKEMLDEICNQLKLTSIKYNKLDDMIDAIAVDKCKLCTYCWNGKE